MKYSPPPTTNSMRKAAQHKFSILKLKCKSNLQPDYTIRGDTIRHLPTVHWSIMWRIEEGTLTNQGKILS